MAETMVQAPDRNHDGICRTEGTILIVDDSPDQLESLTTLLTEQGYTVHAFLDGNPALKFVESTLPDLILLDVLMPGMDGYQVCRQLKACDRTWDIPIIFLTVITESLDRIQGFRLGAADFITRPFETEEVLARVKIHLTLRRQQKQLVAKNIQLQESEEFYRLILSSISDTVFLTDDSGAFKFICPNVNVIFGYSVQEVQALGNISKLLGEDLFVPAKLEIPKEIRNIERTITDQAGKAHDLLVNVKCVSIQQGTQLYTCRDITKRKQAEAARQESDARLYEVLQSSYDEMEQRVHERTAELSQANASLKAEIAERRRAEEALQAAVLEKERLFQAEARRRQEAETLHEVAAVISATTDRPVALGLILDQLKRVVPYDSASVMLISDDSLDMVAQRGLQSEKPFLAPLRLENYPHLGQVLGNRQPVMIADTIADARWQVLPYTSHIRCWLGVPLMIQDKVIGLLNVDKAQPGFYTEREASLAMAFADLASIALENARLFDQIRRRAQDLEALEAISSGLRKAGTREAMQQFIVEKSVEALSGDAGALLQVESGMMVVKAEYGQSTGLLDRPQLPMNCAHWQAVRTGEPQYTTDDRGQSGSWDKCAIWSAMMRDMAAGVVIPLKTAEATVGLLHMVFSSRREFSDENKRMLATIAEIAGNALHRVGILETQEKRVADRTRELTALYEVTAVSSEALNLQTMLERSLERVLKAMRSSTATIHLLDERGETLILAAYQTIAPAGSFEIDYTKPTPNSKEWLIVRGDPLIIPDLSSGSQLSWATGVNRAITYAGAPMRVAGKRLGVLGVARDADQQFSVEEVALLASIADQVAVTVENARLRQHAEQIAIVEERARLARELHDSVTQCLSSVTLLAQAASDFSDACEWERVKHYLERIRDTGGQALKEMRLLLYELQPPSTEQGDLIEMLTRRLDAVEERAGVEVRLVTEDWRRLPALAEEALYRIAQEALNNALKHSSASTVTIVLRGNPDGADLEVNDNGIGFDPESVKRKGGIGLLSMQQRAERLGGELTIRSAPGKGTSIKVSLRNRQ